MSVRISQHIDIPMRTMPAERKDVARSSEVRVQFLEDKIAYLEGALKRLIPDFPSFEPHAHRDENICEVWGEIEVPACFSDPEARAFRALAADFGHEVALESMLKFHKKGGKDDL
ncbi:hypothetical protein [Pseudosulfitobacter pseudonitzschiae]|uniref:hypothetical protein n=1 Tax=Pseudosulfitobacter pseudonitzschiae TaxID=1402135 RepID=UPI001AF86D92|nr:hypothetical protein [Pseudosulfitobacter pseudonitzschiae]MBM1816231.1 hypothetical protein [Pseudosulfitobacter pseudonitzschiae]MBM1833722.1 hypothetical protein [Pseudosulfitobacter pseudonitzschiae]MBM1838588.1 hypothetical protein [Pseudosulfitobacter pseudonitzschiae]MBM1842936.1 hypothetical protein [Pseudosulfitobacter pseudonitzschiae]MBM1847802.1 hypothetical protein [Pseudosulfitobacter pseudonitzschiae]